MIERELYLKRIRPFIDTDMVKVMTGMRRSGKSIMLELIKGELLKRGVKSCQLVSLNFEDMCYIPLLTAATLYNELIKRAQSFSGKAYFFLDEIQENIYRKAKNYRDERIYECDNYEEFKERVKDGGFFLCHWDGTPETEAKIKEDTQATIRCVPFDFEQTPGIDMVSGKPAKYRVLIARSY